MQITFNFFVYFLWVEVTWGDNTWPPKTDFLIRRPAARGYRDRVGLSVQSTRKKELFPFHLVHPHWEDVRVQSHGQDFVIIVNLPSKIGERPPWVLWSSLQHFIIISRILNLTGYITARVEPRREANTVRYVYIDLRLFKYLILRWINL